MATTDSGAVSDGNGATVLPRVGKRGAPQAFARKLYEILTTESEELISWNVDGTAFHVRDVDSFSVETLTKYYRHSKFSSFQRQLNLYSFRKIVKGPDAGGYSHPMFHRDRPDDLYHVRRSISGSARYEPAKTTAAAAARRNAGRVASKASGGTEWLPPRSHKSGGAARRVGKIRGGTSAGSRAGARKAVPSTTTPACAHMADRGNVVSSKAAAATAATADASAGERSPWTSGESSDSDVSVREAGENPESSSDESDSDLSEAEDQGKKKREDGGSRRANIGTVNQEGIAASRKSDTNQGRQFHGVPTAEEQAITERSTNAGSCGERLGQGGSDSGVHEAGGDGQPGGVPPPATSPSRNSPFTFFKKTFSFMERQSNNRHSRGLSVSSVDMTAAEQPAASATSSSLPSPVDDVATVDAQENISRLMVDTSATARAAAAGVGGRPPPVSVTGRLALDPTTAAGNKVLTSSPLTPKSSAEASVAAAAAAMPPPPKREQREELGLVEQLTNMVEVFDICDLLRKVSNSNSSRLDKHGGIAKPAGGGGGVGAGGTGVGLGQQSHHSRSMSVESSPLPQSPQTTRDGQAGLGSLASMELVRDSSKEWDTLMAGSADVSDLSNTMVQSVAEFFSF